MGKVVQIKKKTVVILFYSEYPHILEFEIL